MLWKAILAGCDRREQAFSQLFRNVRGRLYSCALGAAYESTFNDSHVHLSSQTRLKRLKKKYPVLLEQSTCPECQSPFQTVESTIIHFNDSHKWSREKIAVEFIKPLEEEKEGGTLGG